jgi:hypothetical protein
MAKFASLKLHLEELLLYNHRELPEPRDSSPEYILTLLTIAAAIDRTELVVPEYNFSESEEEDEIPAIDNSIAVTEDHLDHNPMDPILPNMGHNIDNSLQVPDSSPFSKLSEPDFDHELCDTKMFEDVDEISTHASAVSASHYEDISEVSDCDDEHNSSQISSSQSSSFVQSTNSRIIITSQYADNSTVTRIEPMLTIANNTPALFYPQRQMLQLIPVDPVTNCALATSPAYDQFSKYTEPDAFHWFLTYMHTDSKLYSGPPTKDLSWNNV